VEVGEPVYTEAFGGEMRLLDAARRLWDGTECLLDASLLDASLLDALTGYRVSDIGRRKAAMGYGIWAMRL
jgi:hypothetical protein